MSKSLWPHESQHARPPCPSPTPGVYSNPCPLSQWCHPAISSSVIPFSSCPQSFPAPGSFSMSQLFAWGSQSIGVSASTSVLPMNTQDWSPLGWTGCRKLLIYRGWTPCCQTIRIGIRSCNWTVFSVICLMSHFCIFNIGFLLLQNHLQVM